VHRFLSHATAVLFALILVSSLSCAPIAEGVDKDVVVAPGVLFSRTGPPGDGFQFLIVDLAKASVRPVVVAQNVKRDKNNFVGDAFTVREWCEKSGAVGGLNGGYFGVTYDEVGSRKQIVQLAVVDGKVVAPGSDTPSSRTPGERYLRSAIGFYADGRPEITWATGTVKNIIRTYETPTNPAQRRTWTGIRYAVACGPRLFAGGKRRITDNEERLVSPGNLIRAFVAYDTDASGKPAHFLMGRADSASYSEVADFLEQYFAKHFRSKPREAMCLDGGSSGQLVYKSDQTLVDAEPTGVRVPTAVLLVPKH
jgi:hypothetical protein